MVLDLRPGIATPARDAAAPPADCQRCPRLAGYRAVNRAALPHHANRPIPAFGDPAARLLIVGLAPGLHGANRTGRPFTGDAAGDLLYGSLLAEGLAAGTYGARADDSLRLVGCRITNAAKCVPPQNRPLPVEVAACNSFLAAEIAALPGLRAILALGHLAHGAVLLALKLRRSRFPFAHGARHTIAGGLALYDSYHCSRYNTNTGRLTPAMFAAVLATIGRDLAARP